MSKLFTIHEAAEFLGLSVQTLRNWDKAGKIKCIRKPGSKYRLFAEDDLNAAKAGVKPRLVRPGSKGELYALESDTDVKRLIARLHRIVRDRDGRSSIIERFDELTKLLLVHAHMDGRLDPKGLAPAVFANQIKKAYAQFASQVGFDCPDRFMAIHLDDGCIAAVFEHLVRFDTHRIAGDLKGLIYEEMIGDIFEKGDNQQFFTPRTVVAFMGTVLSGLTVGSICDPASGTGGFLINLVNNSDSFNHFTALEIDPRLAWVSGMNLEAHGCTDYTSVCLDSGGTLGPDALCHRSEFDAIITNPPFGSDYSDAGGLKNYRLGTGRKSRRRGVLFIERCLDLLKDGGCMAIVIDDGVLNHAANEDVRQLILEQGELLAVVSLPATAFMPYASVESSILVIRKTATPDLNNRTFFARADNVGKKPNGNEDYLYDDDGQERLNNDLVGIVDQWDHFRKSGRGTDSDACYTANIHETFEHDAVHAHRIDFAFHHYSRALIKTALNKHGERLLRLTDVCSEINEPLVPAKDLPDQTLLYTGLANIVANSETYSQVRVQTNAIKSSVRRYQQGDILFSRMRPNLRKCVSIVHEEAGYCSSECVVLRPKKGIMDGRLLSAILRSDFVYGQIVHQVTGIGRPRISVKNLRTLMIPAPHAQEHAVSLNNFAAAMDEASALKAESVALLKQSTDLQSQSTNALVEHLLG